MKAEISEITQRIDNGTLFQSLSTPYIVFGVDDPDFTILEENHAHARVAMVERSRVIGRPLLDVFPDTSEQYIETGVSQLVESVRRVIKTGHPDSMPQLSYDLKDQSGTFVTKYWSIIHHPVKGKNGQVIAVCQETKDITNEIKMGQQLERAEHQLDQVLASSMIGTYAWDILDDKLYADENLATMFGLPKTAATKGLELQEYIAAIVPEDRDRVQHEISQALSQKKPYESEYRTRGTKDGVRWVIARGHVDTDDEGKALNFSGVVVDITDRKLAEQALTESESRLRFMADSMPQLVWIARPDGYHEYYNQRWYDFTGTKPGETDGEGWNALFHPRDREQAWKMWRQCLKTGEPYEIEYRLFHAPSRTYRWVIGRAMPFRDESGEIVKWYGTCTDIDEQKRTAQIQTFLGNVSKELSLSLNYKQMLRKITKLCVPAVADWCTIDLYDAEEGFTQVGIAHADPKKISTAQHYREHNPIHIDDPTGVPAVIRSGKSEYYPFLSNAILEKYIEDPKVLTFMKSLNIRSLIIAPISVRGVVVGGISFVSSDSGRYYSETDLHMIEELAARISLAMTNSQLYEESQSELKRRHQLERELLLEKQKLESRVKERTRQLQQTNEGLRSEIIKRHAIEKELKVYSEDLARSNRELEDFAYVASHDLQEPLRKIQAFSNLLKSEYSKQLGEGYDYIERMNAAASRMSTLIQDLLSFSRVTTRSNPKVKVNLKTIADEVLQDLETRIEDVKGKVVVGDLPSVKADPTHMRQLLQNLISNALKFHQPDRAPIVKITSKPVGDMHEIRVQDNGIGFDEKYLDKIFSVFQRLHGREAYEGTGIGLAVCRKIVEQCGGTITAESKKGEGATFIVQLPQIKEKKRI